MNKADQYATLALVRQIELQRAATWILNDLLALLDQLRLDLAEAALRADPAGSTSAFQRRRRLKALLDETEEMIADVMEEIRRRAESFYSDLLEVAEEDERQNFLLVYGLALTGSLAATGPTMTIGGATVKEHTAKLEDDLNFRLRAALRDSVAAGREAEEIFNEIKGKPALPGPVASTSRQVEAIVRTGVDSVPSEAAKELAPRANVISPHGWQHISVLDNRTTAICRGRAWKKWDAKKEPVGHALPFSPPPLHPNCRSRLVLIFLDEPETTRQTLARWIDQFTPSEQQRLFGKKNLELWRRGLLTDTQLLRQHNRPLDPKELRRRTEAKKDPQKGFPFV